MKQRCEQKEQIEIKTTKQKKKHKPLTSRDLF